MKVIKRDGRTQDFDLSKIKTSIHRASDDADQPLNNSDINNLAKSIEENLKELNKDKISFDVIKQIVISELEKAGFNTLSKYYNLGSLE